MGQWLNIVAGGKGVGHDDPAIGQRERPDLKRARGDREGAGGQTASAGQLAEVTSGSWETSYFTYGDQLVCRLFSNLARTRT